MWFFSSDGESAGSGNAEEKVNEGNNAKPDNRPLRQKFEEDVLPVAMAYGLSIVEFWGSNPHILKIYTRAYEEKRKILDEQMWAQGQYVYAATYAAVGQWFGDANSKRLAKYPDRPFMWPQRTQDEIDDEEADRELRRMIAAEEAWIRVEKRNGLADSL